MALNNDTNPLRTEMEQSPGAQHMGFTQKFWNSLNTVYVKYKDAFVHKVFTWVSLPPIDALCAQVAGESYKGLRDWELRDWEMKEFILDEKNSSETACIYANAETKICIIGYRGTVVTDIKDITSDAQIVLDIQGIDPRVKAALHIYDTIRREYPGYAIRVCGHSLGGTTSYIVAKHRNPARCVVFNPGVSLNTFFVQMLEDTIKHVERTQNTYTYKILWDIISTVGFVGHVKTFVIKATDPLALHTMDNFL